MSKQLAHKLQNRARRQGRVRAVVSGTAKRPRLSVSVSNLHVTAQLIDDGRPHRDHRLRDDDRPEISQRHYDREVGMGRRRDRRAGQGQKGQSRSI